MRRIVNLDGGSRRVNHAVGEIIFSSGGYCPREDYKNKQPMDVHILKTVSLQWSVLSSLKPRSSQYNFAPFQRYGHTAKPFNDCIYIWGGRNYLRACNRVFLFQCKQPRVGNSCCARENPRCQRRTHVMLHSRKTLHIQRLRKRFESILSRHLRFTSEDDDVDSSESSRNSSQMPRLSLTQIFRLL